MWLCSKLCSRCWRRCTGSGWLLGRHSQEKRPSVKLLTCLFDWALTGRSIIGTRDFKPARAHQSAHRHRPRPVSRKSPPKDCLIACAEKLRVGRPRAMTSSGESSRTTRHFKQAPNYRATATAFPSGHCIFP